MSWIKMETSLLHDGRVRDLSRKLSRSRHEVVGMLFDFWSLADSQADENGLLGGWSKGDVDDHLRTPGFSEAMPKCWLDVDASESVILPKYQEHNGSTAKTRALAQRRQRDHRKRVTEPVTHASRTKRDASLSISNTLSIDLKKGVQGETNPLAGAQESICDEFGKACFDHYLPIVSDWLASSGKKYKDYSAFMRNWIRRERDEGKGFFRQAAKSNAKQNNLEKAREALYGDPRGRVGTDGISGRGVLDVSSHTGTRGNLGRGAGSFLTEPVEAGSKTLPTILGLGVWTDSGANNQGNPGKRTKAREDDEEGSS